MDLLVFDGPPQTLDKDVVAPGDLAIDLPPRNIPRSDAEIAGLDLIFLGFILGKRAGRGALK
jgi:hypothetical protein